MIYDEKTAFLLDKAREAVRFQDWDRVLEAARYNAEMGNTIIGLFEDEIPLEPAKKKSSGN